MRRLGKHADWLLLVAVNGLAFWMLARPLLSQGRVYHDNVRLFSVFRDSLHALNRYSELMLWNPEYTTFGFPAFYFAHLGTNTFTPLSTLVLFSAWAAGLLGIHIADYTRLYILYVYLAVPLLLSVSFYALARQIVRHPTARVYLILVAAFSPGVIFAYSDNGPEQTAYGFLAAAAFLSFYRRPGVGRFLVMALAAAACTAALNHLALYWNVVFVPLFILVTIVLGERVRGSLRRAWGAVPPFAWCGLALLLASYLAWPAVTFAFGRDIVRSTLDTQVYDVGALLAGNPIEPLSASTPGIGFEWQPRPGGGRPEWALTTYPAGPFAYTYLGALTLALCLLGLAMGRPPWRTRLLALVAFFCLLAPLAGSSGLFTVLLEAVYPLRAVNHFSDTTFRNGTGFLFLLGAGLGLEALLRPRYKRRAAAILFVLFSVSTLAGSFVLFRVYPLMLSVPVVSFFVMASILYMVIVVWLFAPGAKVRRALGAMAVLALVDVSTIAALHCRYVVWPRAEGPFPQLPSQALSFPEHDKTRQYADELLTLGDRLTVQRAGVDATRLRTLPMFALYDVASSAQLFDVKGLGAVSPADSPSADGSLKAIRRTYNSFKFETRTDREMYLFWRNSYFAGWSANVRETGPTPILKAFGMFMAARVPAGTSEITFRFAPGMFVPLFLWTYSSLALLALGTVVVVSVRGQLQAD